MGFERKFIFRRNYDISLRDLRIPYLLRISHDVKWLTFGIIWIFIYKQENHQKIEIMMTDC